MKRISGFRGKATKAGLLACGTAIALPLLSSAAFAQASSDSGASSSAEILVTAQRRSERLEDVPMTVAVVTQETLANNGVNSVRDLANVTSGFQVNNSGSYPQPAIRGITTTTAGSYENNVALFVDGLYQFTPQILNMDLPNVQDIQILKGPQGTLYGRNATGGAILLNTIDPGNEWTGSAEATYGRFNDRRARAFVAGPLSDKIGVSLAGTLRRTSGYYKKASRSIPGETDGHALGLKQESIRAKVKAELTEGFRVTLGYNYISASDPRGVFFTPTENVNNSYVPNGRNTRPRDLYVVAGDAFKLGFKQHEASLKMELDTGIGTLRSITGYANSKTPQNYDSSGTYVPDLYISAAIHDEVWQQSLDYNITAIDNVDLVLGGNYYNAKSQPYSGKSNAGAVYLGPASYSPYTYPDPATTLVPLSDYRKSYDSWFWRTKEAWAVFGDATFHASDKLTINVGGRYSKETQDVSAKKVYYCTVTGGCTVGSNTVPVGGVISTPFDRVSSAKKSSYAKFTPRATIRYEIAPRTNIYATYSKGFRGGEWNGSVPNDNPDQWLDVKQESIDAFEVGLKSGGGRFNYEVSGFYYDYKDLQVSSVAFIGNPAVTVTTLQNAPKAKIYGAEANFDFQATDNLKLRAGGTWLHARYGSNFIWVGAGVNPAAAGFNTNDNPLKTFQNVSPAYQDLSGQQMARSPNFSGYVGMEYNVPNGDGGLRFALNAKYTDSYVVTDPSLWGGETAASYAARKAAAPAGTVVLPNNNQIFNAAGAAGTAYLSSAEKQRARQGAYALINASITWTDPTDHYYARVWGNNLGDAKVRNHYRPGTATYIPMGEPMTYGFTAGYKF